MKNYLISDLHLGHRNCSIWRGFTDEAGNLLKGISMEDYIVKQINSVVTMKDRLFILGDLTMDNPKMLDLYWDKINGNKEVILGNHDTPRVIKWLVEHGVKVHQSKKYAGLLLTHFPVLPSIDGTYEGCRGNVHGHIHKTGSDYFIPNGNYLNVNAEFCSAYIPVKQLNANDENDFVPISIEQALLFL